MQSPYHRETDRIVSWRFASGEIEAASRLCGIVGLLHLHLLESTLISASWSARAGDQVASSMRDAYGVLSIPVILVTAVLLTRRWPGVMRRVSRCLAAVTVAALVCVIVTGWRHRPDLTGAIHWWVSHGVMILAWNAIPFATGVTMASLRRPVVQHTSPWPWSRLLVVLFLASVTGYVGPAYGPIDALASGDFRCCTTGHFPRSRWHWRSRGTTGPGLIGDRRRATGSTRRLPPDRNGSTGRSRGLIAPALLRDRVRGLFFRRRRFQMASAWKISSFSTAPFVSHSSDPRACSGFRIDRLDRCRERRALCIVNVVVNLDQTRNRGSGFRAEFTDRLCDGRLFVD